MVRNYVRKTNRQSWDESSMLFAIKSVIDDKNSYTKASANYNVPHSTLQDRVKKLKMVKTDNGRLRNDLTTLKECVVVLESNLNCSTTNHNFDVVLQLIQELVECVSDAVVHGLPVSSSTLLTIRVTDYMKSLSDMAQHLSLSLPSELKLSSDFNYEKYFKSPVDQVSSIFLMRHHTLLERKKKRHAYADLDERRKKGECNIVVRYRNGALYVSQYQLTTKANDLHSQHSSSMEK
ncbi:hypothetical protein QTP88_027583 [Uroleucon formosanum]